MCGAYHHDRGVEFVGSEGMAFEEELLVPERAERLLDRRRVAPLAEALDEDARVGGAAVVAARKVARLVHMHNELVVAWLELLVHAFPHCEWRIGLAVAAVRRPILLL